LRACGWILLRSYWLVHNPNFHGRRVPLAALSTPDLWEAPCPVSSLQELTGIIGANELPNNHGLGRSIVNRLCFPHRQSRRPRLKRDRSLAFVPFPRPVGAGIFGVFGLPIRNVPEPWPYGGMLRPLTLTLFVRVARHESAKGVVTNRSNRPKSREPQSLGPRPFGACHSGSCSVPSM
jgi:hypothetical protein